jgi:ribonuclease HII
MGLKTETGRGSLRAMTQATSDLVLGIDEAGRGPILGPLVMACVGLRPRQAASLTRAGVMDSKRFGAGEDAHEARRQLAERIRGVAAHAVVLVIDVDEIDRRTVRGELNRLEQEQARALLGAAPPARRIVCDGARMFQPLAADWPMLEARDRGEEHHVAVAAASILAKVRRDELFLKIAARYAADFGPLGGWGYMNAPTRQFLRAYIERRRDLPPEGRRSWPWDFASDLLGQGFDPLAGFPELLAGRAVARPQLALAL